MSRNAASEPRAFPRNHSIKLSHNQARVGCVQLIATQQASWPYKAREVVVCTVDFARLVVSYDPRRYPFATSEFGAYGLHADDIIPVHHCASSCDYHKDLSLVSRDLIYHCLTLASSGDFDADRGFESRHSCGEFVTTLTFCNPAILIGYVLQKRLSVGFLLLVDERNKIIETLFIIFL